MGLILAALNAAGTTIQDQWKDYFYCEALPADVIVAKGHRKTSALSANKGTDNIITNGSGIAVADGQAMIIVEDGKVVEFCAQPGNFTWDASSEPSIFTGSLTDAIKQTFATIGKRFAYGGDTGKDQRIYYFNTKEIVDNKFGTPNPIPFRIVEERIGLDLDTAVRCSGTYSYRVTDPLLFYANVCGNVESYYTRDELDPQLKTEFISALQPAFAKISTQQIRPNELPAHATELCDAMNAELTRKWGDLRGIQVVSIAMNPITLPEEDAEKIKQLQIAATNMNAGMATANTLSAQQEAIKAAAANANGAVNGFMGYNMAQNAGGIDTNGLIQQTAAAQAAKAAAAPAAPASPAAEAETWTCECGTVNTGKFCSNCGKPKPAGTWTCSCGTVNTGKFCTNCGKPRP